MVNGPFVSMPAPFPAQQPIESEVQTPEREVTREDLNLRFQAASTMSLNNDRDAAMARVASDAALGGEAEIARRAIQGIIDNNTRDQTAHDCAVALSKRNQRKQGIEIASSILDSTIRDQTLSELAK